MNTINEMCLAWYVWVNGNYDILIMTITLIVVAGLVLEVVRLKSKVDRLNADMYHHIGEQMSLLQADQVKVNVHLAEDIARIDGKENDNREFTDKVYRGLVSVNTWQDSQVMKLVLLEQKVDLLGKVVGKFKIKAIKK